MNVVVVGWCWAPGDRDAHVELGRMKYVIQLWFG